MNINPVTRRKSGFTLIELLVVIAIIAILAAILFPVFARARENARRASCQSNEKNIALGFKQYIQDNGEKYPPVMASAYDLKNNDGIQEYIKSSGIFFCPSDSEKVLGSYGYKLNAENESAIDNTTTTVLLNETGTRHFEGMNAAYVDGHVKWGKGQIGAATAVGSAAPPAAAFPTNFTITRADYGGTSANNPGTNCVAATPGCPLGSGQSTTYLTFTNNTGGAGTFSCSWTTSVGTGAGLPRDSGGAASNNTIADGASKACIWGWQYDAPEWRTMGSTSPEERLPAGINSATITFTPSGGSALSKTMYFNITP